MVVSNIMLTFADVNNKQKTRRKQVMATTIRVKRIKTFNDISLQCERIFTLHIKGYGSNKMYEVCEEIFFKVLKKNGY